MPLLIAFISNRGLCSDSLHKRDVLKPASQTVLGRAGSRQQGCRGVGRGRRGEGSGEQGAGRREWQGWGSAGSEGL